MVNLLRFTIISPKPDPFDENERDVILNHFHEKQRYYFPFVLTLFGTGARPSEIIALRWSDVDFSSQTLSITKSRYMNADK